MWKAGLNLPQLLVTQFQAIVFTSQEAFIVLDLSILHKKDQKLFKPAAAYAASGHNAKQSPWIIHETCYTTSITDVDWMGLNNSFK